VKCNDSDVHSSYHIKGSWPFEFVREETKKEGEKTLQVGVKKISTASGGLTGSLISANSVWTKAREQEKVR
jgi:hypothetical protein